MSRFSEQTPLYVVLRDIKRDLPRADLLEWRKNAVIPG